MTDERPGQHQTQEQRDRIANYQFQVNINYHMPLSDEQREAINTFCAEFVDEESSQEDKDKKIAKLTVLIQGLLRLVLRQMCGAGAQVKPEQDLMELLMYVAETFEPFFGIEYVDTFNEFVDEDKFESIAYIDLKYGNTAEFAYAMHDWIQVNIVKKKIQQQRIE